MKFVITKADGSTEYFKIEKLRRSLRRAGAAPDEINMIVQQITTELYDGIKTQEIYRQAFSLLRRSKTPIAARYSLRRALLGLGPTGFPFEKFLAKLFTADGYDTKTGIMLQGKCAPHEIDIAAYNQTDSFVGEAKFHARPGIKTDLQVAMYSYARLLDLKGTTICNTSVCGVKDFWLITNTKFTTTAERYGECVGLKMLSWDYPIKNNLHDRIQRAKVYPITVLPGLSSSQISLLISYDIIICRDIVENPHVLTHLHISKSKQDLILSEAKSVIEGV
ncbi:MAG TPA: ATP cone domain-containing protein [Candidatus Paceibacterota bacterium]|nr:ATP cone domain-containing protein [Candidatus Paceibacterota bacterium]